MGIAGILETITAIGKPIIAQVDADLIEGGVYPVLSSDLIVAKEDRKFIDHHLGMGQTSPIGGMLIEHEDEDPQILRDFVAQFAMRSL